MRVMRTSKWMVLALLVVAITITAAAQQSTPASEGQQPVSATPQSTSTPASEAQQPASASQSVSAQPALPPAVAAPVTMDQVVDRVIEREKRLITMMAPRTP